MKYKNFVLFGFALFCLASVSQADPKDDEKEVLQEQSQPGLGDLIKSTADSEIQQQSRDGVCPVKYVQWVRGIQVVHYPSSSQDPDCPPH